MKLLYLLLPLFGSAIGLALDSQPSNCVATCPPPKCPAGNALEACKCLNEREYACQAKCPEYKPRILHCPRLPVTKTTKVIPPKSTPTQCVCEEVFCILSFPEGCFCQNDAKKACFEKCGGEEPTYQDCSVPIDAVKPRAPEPKPVPAPVPAPVADNCVCEDVMCILSIPEGCYCRNDAKKACYEKCGGVEPTYQDCSVDVKPRAPAPVPAPVPEPVSEPEPKACVCEATFCTQVWPQSCWCAYDAQVACAKKCGKPAPPASTCPRTDIKARVAEPKPVPAPVVPAPKCECPQVFCIQSWPESCYCQNAAKERCYQQCGGKKPTLQVCPPQTTATLSTRTTTTKSKPSSTSKGPQPPKPTNQICGGGRGGAFQECPAGQTCITNPFEPGSCGPACDQLGICVGENMCGGFAGFECDTPGQICVDDPRDDCDPLNGGSDCGGLCAWPQ